VAKEREIIYESLTEILENGQYSHIVEKAVLDKHDYLEKSKKAYIKRMIEGTVEMLPAIDKIIDSYAKTKIKSQKPLIRTVLRMSVYEIMFMDSSPDYAVVSEAVKLVKKHGFHNLAPFVNGVLRTVSKNKETLSVNSEEAFPSWLLEFLKETYDTEIVQKIVDSSLKEREVTIRKRSELKNDSNLKKHPLLDYAYIVPKGTAVSELPGFSKGAFAVQDVSSMMVVEKADIHKGDRVIDVCAAPGGKSIHARDFGGVVIARDISERKIDLINENLLRCGIGDIVTQVWDATVFDPDLEETADVVIADVPCSGLGVLSKKADIKLKLQKEDMDSLPELQWNIIKNVYKYVKVGKTLMYSTCTINPTENRKMAERIVNELPFELEFDRQFIQGVDETDGFYFAKLKRVKK